MAGQQNLAQKLLSLKLKTEACVTKFINVGLGGIESHLASWSDMSHLSFMIFNYDNQKYNSNYQTRKMAISNLKWLSCYPDGDLYGLVLDTVANFN